MARRASARYDIEAKDKTRRGVESAKRNITSLNKVVALGKAAFSAAGLASLGYVAAVTSGIRVLDDYNRKLLQTNAILKSTGFSAGLAAKEIEGFANELARNTLADESGVLTAANQLLTFRSIAGETFKETLRLAQDLSATGFGSITSSTLVLAKALEDPIAQLGSLSRVGITLSKSQKDLVKDLVNTGDKAKAQGLILSALRDQIGGAGAAEAEGTVAGSVDSLGQSWRELQKTLADGSAINNSIRLVDSLRNAVDSLNKALGIEGQLERLDERIRSAQDAPVVSPNSRLADSGVGFTSEEEKQKAINALIQQRATLENDVFAEGQKQLAEKTRALELQKVFNEEIKNQQAAEAEAVKAEEAQKTAIEEKTKAAEKFLEVQRKARDALVSLQDAANDDALRFKEELQSEESRLQAEINLLNSLRGNSNISNDDIDTLIARRIEQQQVLGTKTDEVTNAQGKLNDELKKGTNVGKELGDVLTRAAVDASTSFDSFGDVVDSVGKNILALLTRIAITEPLQEAASGLFSGLFGGG